MTLGQEFNGFATTLGYDHTRLTENASLMFEIKHGRHGYRHRHHDPPRLRAPLCSSTLREITELDLRTAGDLVEATSDTGSFMSFSSTLKRNAMKLSKICNDPPAALVGPPGGLRRDQPPPPCRRAPASCPARSTRSSPRS